MGIFVYFWAQKVMYTAEKQRNPKKTEKQKNIPLFFYFSGCIMDLLIPEKT